jgi:hypothetical protein
MPDAPAVDAFIQGHPLADTLTALRRLVRDVSPEVTEAIKWNAPSFRTTEHFATMNLSGSGGRVRLVLHRGARAAPVKLTIDDPEGLLEWQAPDRALVTLLDAGDVEKKRTSLLAILRQWVKVL